MESESILYWQIQDYLSGRLNQEEKIRFEAKLAEDPEFLDLYTQHKFAHVLLKERRKLAAEKFSLDYHRKQQNSLRLKQILIFLGVLGSVATMGVFLFEFSGRSRSEAIPAMRGQDSSYMVKGEDVESGEKNAGKTLFKANTHEEKSQGLKMPTLSRDTQHITIPKTADTDVAQKGHTVIASHKDTSAPQRHIAPIQAPEKQPCLNVTLSAQVSTSSTCVGEKSGAIHLSHFKGGVPPYTFSVQSDGENMGSGAHLGAGSYLVTISDGRQCSTQIVNVTVNEVICKEQEKTFNPFMGEILEFSITDVNSRLIVYEKTGAIYYSAHFNKGEQIVWDGLSLKGHLEAGYFSYEIKYEDGKQKYGAITITR